LQRVSTLGYDSGLGIGAPDRNLLNELTGMVKFITSRMSDVGVMVFSADRKILHINPYLEEVTGIRAEKAVGEMVISVARDSAFVSFVDDVLGRTQVDAEPVSDEFEFSGVNYKMECFGVGSAGQTRAYVLTASNVG
jgi:hypothetical protein